MCNSDAFLGHWIVEAMKRGSELVTIDPQLTWIASKSKYWLRLRPGTDAALALGMMNVIIDEDLVDHDFIDKWTYGFEALAERVKDYPPSRGGRDLLDRRAKLIVEAARFYAKAHPSTIQWGLAVDMSKIGTHTAHAIACLGRHHGQHRQPRRQHPHRPGLRPGVRLQLRHRVRSRRAWWRSAWATPSTT